MGSRFVIRRTGEAATGPALAEVSLPPPPREARLKSKVRIGAAVIATLVVGAAALLFVLAMDHGRALERLRDHGVVTTGTVEELKISQSRNSKSYRITYRFEHDGEVVRDSEAVSSTRYERFSIGAPIPVTYERGAPANHELFAVGERELSRFWTAVAIAAAAYVVAAIVAAACADTIYRRRLALLRDGRLIAATIVKVGRYMRKKQGRKVTLTFTATTGEEITKRHWMPKGTVEPGQEGQSVGYLVAPENEKRGEPVVVVLGSCEVV